MTTENKCPCCYQTRGKSFKYDGGAKEWYVCLDCGFNRSGILTDEQLIQAAKEYFMALIETRDNAEAKINAILKGRQQS